MLLVYTTKAPRRVLAGTGSNRTRPCLRQPWLAFGISTAATFTNG
jgi:hypothetical protein